ncbi:MULTISPECIES: glutaredoxin-like protein NrdH [Rothia]|uniref:Glutaredoxin-like protein NrdH n=1 Tax=Rothia amarae TaxID=169480 RepID=A0A7H2BMH9_9MICC|nr:MULTISPECIES: glutaredoxin-like protein NrdH [Rothia]QNV40875.1 glutaredoxin-like protein NrdH [Rothia amarae]SIL53850.1 Glutaredoxin-like protein NrdH [Mycobacteroides abscessus subsp. abscessus]
MSVTVYTKPACVQCNMTYRALDKNGIDYTTVDVTEDAAALARIKELGYMQAPVVIAGDEHWSGFQPDRINALAS